MDEIRISHVEKSYTTLSTDLVIGGAKRPSRTRKVLQDVNLDLPRREALGARRTEAAAAKVRS